MPNKLELLVDRAPGKLVEFEAAHGGTGTTRIRQYSGSDLASFSVLAWDFPPGTSEGPHDHRGDAIGFEQYLVIQGRIVIVVDGSRYELAAGDSICIPPEAEREARNESDELVRIIMVFEQRVPEGLNAPAPSPLTDFE